MLSLFERLINENRISEAILVGQNMLNKNPGNKVIFDAYFSFLCKLAERLPALEERKQFVDQANVALAFFVENTDLDETTLEGIIVYQHRIEKLHQDINSILEAKLFDEKEKTKLKNDSNLKKLFSLKDKLLGAKTHDEFDTTLKEIGEVDLLIDKSSMNADQNSAYDMLTREHTEIVSSKMRELEYKDNIAYNKKAANAYALALKEFTDHKDRYKNQTQLFSLASTTLFAFDAGRLFNETLIYYNHVYSYIFSKLDDDGKLALTRYSIECERSLR